MTHFYPKICCDVLENNMRMYKVLVYDQLAVVNTVVCLVRDPRCLFIPWKIADITKNSSASTAQNPQEEAK